MKYIALFFAFFSLVGCTLESKTNDIWLIPKNYEGYVFAFYNVKGTPTFKKEGDYKVLVINDKGYTVTSAPDVDSGIVTDRYYYTDKNGKRIKINKNCVRILGTGGIQNDVDSSTSVRINYSGIEVTRNRCSEKFRRTRGLDEEDLNQKLQEVVEKYYGVDLYLY